MLLENTYGTIFEDGLDASVEVLLAGCTTTGNP